MANIKVGVLVGSLREGSNSRAIADQLVAGLPENYESTIIQIGDLPLYNEDLEANVPAEWTRLRAEVKDQDAFIFVTSEYNRNMPASIKNALDVASRPYGDSGWDGKPAMVASSSMSVLSGALANHDVRQSLVFLNMPTMQQPEVYIASAQELITDNKISNEGTIGFLQTVTDAFAAHVELYVTK